MHLVQLNLVNPQKLDVDGECGTGRTFTVNVDFPSGNSQQFMWRYIIITFLLNIFCFTVVHVC